MRKLLLRLVNSGMNSDRVVMQNAVQNGMIVHQMDGKTTYLNAPIYCDIYVEQPKGYEKVRKMARSLFVSWKIIVKSWRKDLQSLLMTPVFIVTLLIMMQISTLFWSFGLMIESYELLKLVC